MSGSQSLVHCDILAINGICGSMSQVEFDRFAFCGKLEVKNQKIISKISNDSH